MPEKDQCTSNAIRPNVPNGILNGQTIYKCKDGYSDDYFPTDRNQWCRDMQKPICPEFYEGVYGQALCKQIETRY